MDTKKKLEVMREIDAANQRHVAEWKARQVSALLVDVQEGFIRRVTVDASVEGYCAALGFPVVKITSCRIGGREFQIVSDDGGDLGLHVDDPNVSARGGQANNEARFFGNLLVVKDGGLTDADIEHLLRHTCGIARVDEKGNQTFRRVLTDVEIY